MLFCLRELSQVYKLEANASQAEVMVFNSGNIMYLRGPAQKCGTIQNKVIVFPSISRYKAGDVAGH